MVEKEKHLKDCVNFHHSNSYFLGVIHDHWKI